MVTTATVELQGRQAILRQKGKTITASIESPDDARFDVVSTRPDPPQNPNAGTTKLVVRLPGTVQRVRLEVLLTS
jgi:hypothetical protein